MNVKEKNIIITGGSGLIGNQIIKDLSNLGANCINIDLIENLTNKKTHIF